jgi:hypothetical protein
MNQHNKPTSPTITPSLFRDEVVSTATVGTTGAAFVATVREPDLFASLVLGASDDRRSVGEWPFGVVVRGVVVPTLEFESCGPPT